MSRYYNGYLDANSGLFFRDWQHAARLYVDDVYRLAPKPKWMYYAVFNINDGAISSTAFQQQNRQELNFLVKKMDLPRYTLDTERLNQYNRKTTTYTKINYENVNITFHDDNNGVSNAMWAMYYSHYFADRLNSQTPYSDIDPPAYQTNTYLPKSAFPYRYGLDGSNGYIPFFNSIQLLTLTKHKFTSYLLCHPRIVSWEHDTMDQSEGNGVVENNMSLAYDAVIYTTGTVSFDNPTGFGVLHYDPIQSPLGPNNWAYLQGALNQVYATDLMAQNPFNPIDLGISLLSSTRQLPTLGNLAPYGTTGANAVLPGALSNVGTTSYTSTSGLQTYDFGGAYTTAPISQVLSAPVDNSYVSVATLRADAINNEFATTASNYVSTGSAPITSDVYANNLPKDTPSSIESKIFGGQTAGTSLGEAPGAVNIDYFSQSDVVNLTSVSNSELINNNPQNYDLPDDPFQG